MNGGRNLIIKEIHIYGYGKFENFIINNINSLQVIFGENEAGKSTIMSFIHSIFFGFPLKNQSELRYEPKHHGKYGGKIILHHEKFGNIQIERVKGKAVGDVTVILENGTTGDEELLLEIIDHIDKSFFQSIYSFNIHGLQHVHKVKQEDLSRFLFSAGAIGSNRIFETEKTLQKELENLFKKQGMKPLLNEKLRGLKELELKVQEAKKNISQYENLIKDYELKRDQLKQNRLRFARLTDEKNQLHEWNRTFPLIQDWMKVKKQYDLVKDIQLKQEEIEGIGDLIHKLSEVKNHVERLKNNMDSLQQEMSELEINKYLIENETFISSVLEKAPYINKLDQEAETIRIQIEELSNEIKRIKSELNITANDQEIESLKIGMSLKSNILNLEKKRHTLVDKKRSLDQQLQQLQLEILQRKKNKDTLSRKLLPEDVRVKYEKVHSDVEKQLVEKEIEFVKKQKSLLEKSIAKSNLFSKWGIPILFFSLSIGSFLFQQSELAISLLIIGILYFIFSYYRKDPNDFILNEYKAKERELLEQFRRMESEENGNEVIQLLERDKMIRKQLEVLDMQLEQDERNAHSIAEQKKLWNVEYEKLQSEYQNIAKMLHLPIELGIEHIHQAVTLLDELKMKLLQKNELKNKLLRMEKELHEYGDTIKKISEDGNFQFTDFHSFIFVLKKLLQEELRKFYQWEEKNKKLIEYKEEYHLLEKDKNFYEQQLKSKLNEFQLHTVEEWNVYFEKWERKIEIEKRLEMIQQQIPPMILSKIQSEIDPKPFSDEELYEVEMQMERLQKEIEMLERELAEIKHKIELLENGGTYTELLYQYYDKKFEFQELAKKWATYAIAQYVLSNTINRYKNEKLPKVLQQAGYYLSILTNHAYHEILLDDTNDELLVKRADLTVFHCYELSQATQEQVYIALRFALMTQMDRKWKYPIIIDDGFVHFDDDRLEKMILLLKDISRQYQVIFFTCHRRLLSKFDNDAILYLQ